MTRLSKIYKKGSGLTNMDAVEFEEELLQKQDKKLKKHYLKADAKAFINKFTKMFRSS